MDLFAITCTTCKSRLRVRDPAAIGQILACPKCGGMVMVKPPPAYSELGEQKSDLPTATEMEAPGPQFNLTLHSSAFDVLEDLLSDAPPKVQPPSGKPPSATPQPTNATPAPAAPAKPRFIGGPPAHRSSTPPVHRSATPPLPPSATASAPQVPAVTPKNGKAPGDTTPQATSAPPIARDATPSAGSVSPAKPVDKPVVAPSAITGPTRNYWLLMAGSIAVGTVLAFAAVTAAIHVLRPASVAKAIPKRPATKIPARQPDEQQPSETATIAMAANDAQAAVPSTEANPATETTAATETTPRVAANSDSDPLGLAKSSPPMAAASAAASSPLDKFGQMIQAAVEDPLAKTAMTRPIDKPAMAASDPTPAKPLAPRPAPRDVDVARRLADPLTAIETAGTPLADFVQLLSDLSTIPITLDVPFTPATPQAAVTVNLTSTSVGRALSEGLRPLRLEYVVVDDQLVVRRAEPTTPAPFTLGVKDLTGGDEQQMAELAELLKAVVEPGEWGEDETGGSIAVDVAKAALVITHRRAVQFQVLLAVEKLRSARRLAPSSNSRSDLFRLETRSALASPKLEKPLTLNYSQPARLVTILDRLGNAAGVRIVVDWRDVATASWNPAAEATLVASNQPLAEALDALLNPLDLTWRIIDGQTLQVVTPARLAELAELELYKIETQITAGTGPEAMIAKVRSAFGESAFTAGGGVGEIRFEPESKCLLVWLPQPKQREIETFLRGGKNERQKEPGTSL